MACRNTPTSVCSFVHAEDLGKVVGFSIFLSNEGDVYSLGISPDQAHGHSDQNIVFPEKRIANLMNIKHIACNTSHTLCLDYGGRVFSFESNSHGQLGVGKDKSC